MPVVVQGGGRLSVLVQGGGRQGGGTVMLWYKVVVQGGTVPV